jgi:hypothetical protein
MLKDENGNVYVFMFFLSPLQRVARALMSMELSGETVVTCVLAQECRTPATQFRVEWGA